MPDRHDLPTSATVHTTETLHNAASPVPQRSSLPSISAAHPFTIGRSARVIITLALAMFAGVAHAEMPGSIRADLIGHFKDCPWHQITCNWMKPPPQYASGPMLVRNGKEAQVIVQEFSHYDLQRKCWHPNIDREQPYDACAGFVYSTSHTACVISMRNDMTPRKRQYVLEHELAHCRGWIHD